MFDRSVITAAHHIKPSGRGELEITDAIQWLIDHDLQVRPRLLTGSWIDTGKMEDLLEANRLVLERLERDVQGSVDAESSSWGTYVWRRERALCVPSCVGH